LSPAFTLSVIEYHNMWSEVVLHIYTSSVDAYALDVQRPAFLYVRIVGVILLWLRLSS